MSRLKFVFLLFGAVLATAQYQLPPNSGYSSVPAYGYPYQPFPQRSYPSYLPIYQQPISSLPVGADPQTITPLSLPGSQLPYYVLPVYQQPFPGVPVINDPQNSERLQYPFYPYPFHTHPTYPDPYANIPTEIIDVDENGKPLGQVNSTGVPNWSIPKVEVTSSYTSTASNPKNNPYRSVHTSTVLGKPIQTTVTRTFGPSGSSEPVVQINGQDSGSGILIEAHADEEQNTTEKSESDNNEDGEVTTDAAKENEKEGDTENDDKPFSLSLFG